MVRTHTILPSPTCRPSSRVLNKLGAPATAGVFAKAPSKPTNHSKFTGRCCNKHICASCSHLSVACKSKTKGTRKFGPSSGLFVDYVDGPRFASRRTSATGAWNSFDDGSEDEQLHNGDERTEEGIAVNDSADWIVVEKM